MPELMKLPIVIGIAIVLSLQSCATSSTIIELSNSQSMCITGKGPGQDGAINPFSDTRSISLVKNIGDDPFSVRIQNKNDIVLMEEINAKESAEFVLEKGYVLFLDGGEEGTAKIAFKKAK